METSLWDWLKKHLPEGHYSRIESETSPGFPDVHYSIRGASTGTIELKKSRSPRARIPFKKGGLRSTQIRWIKDESFYNNRIFIVAQVGSDVLLLDAAQVVDSFNSSTLDDLRAMSIEWAPMRSPERLEDALGRYL